MKQVPVPVFECPLFERIEAKGRCESICPFCVKEQGTGTCFTQNKQPPMKQVPVPVFASCVRFSGFYLVLRN